MDAIAQWLILLGTPGLGASGLTRLLARCGTPEAILSVPDQTLASWGLTPESRRWLRHPQLKSIEQDLALLARIGARTVALSDPQYPALLRQIQGPPPVLFVRGDAGCLGRRQLAIVGSRNPSPAGRETARELAFSASKAGFVVTSGLARGIDGAAHRGALDAGGATIAVMGDRSRAHLPRRSSRVG